MELSIPDDQQTCWGEGASEWSSGTDEVWLTNLYWVGSSHCKLLQPFREQTDLLQIDTLSLSCVIPSLLELTLHLQDPSLTKSLALPLLQSFLQRQRFSVFLDPSCDSFDPVAATACLLDPSVMATMLRTDMLQLLNAAKDYIRQQVVNHFCMLRFLYCFFHTVLICRYNYFMGAFDR